MSEEKKPSVFSLLAAWVRKNHANQPSFAAEMKALFRGGRDDLHQVLTKPLADSMDLTAPLGAPGSPTPQQTTAELTGGAAAAEPDTAPQKREVRQDVRKSVLGYALDPEKPKAQDRADDHSRGM